MGKLQIVPFLQYFKEELQLAFLDPDIKVPERPIAKLFCVSHSILMILNVFHRKGWSNVMIGVVIDFITITILNLPTV